MVEWRVEMKKNKDLSYFLNKLAKSLGKNFLNYKNKLTSITSGLFRSKMLNMLR